MQTGLQIHWATQTGLQHWAIQTGLQTYWAIQTGLQLYWAIQTGLQLYCANTNGIAHTLGKYKRDANTSANTIGIAITLCMRENVSAQKQKGLPCTPCRLKSPLVSLPPPSFFPPSTVTDSLASKQGASRPFSLFQTSRRLQQRLVTSTRPIEPMPTQRSHADPTTPCRLNDPTPTKTTARPPLIHPSSFPRQLTDTFHQKGARPPLPPLSDIPPTLTTPPYPMPDLIPSERSQAKSNGPMPTDTTATVVIMRGNAAICLLYTSPSPRD